MQEPEKTTKSESAVTEQSPPTLRSAIARFVGDMNGLAASFPYILILSRVVGTVKAKEINNFVKRNCSLVDSGQSLFSVSLEHVTRLLKLLRSFAEIGEGYELVRRGFLVNLVSQYDSFLGDLLRALFIAKPEVVNGSEKTLSFVQLQSFHSIEDARSFIAEKEIETILRENHLEQLEILERKFKLTLRKDLNILPKFIELTERRNIFTHADGVVSGQYLSVCRENNVSLERIKLGDRLSMSPEYFDTAFETVFELGTKLGHVLWRKVIPSDLSDADASLNEICYTLIEDDKYQLAINILEFFLYHAGKRFSSERAKFVMRINLAQAYKWLGNDKKCVEIVKAQDWSASSRDFKLASAVLLEDYDRAAIIMNEIGQNGEVTKKNYDEWPLFSKFRKTSEFEAAYKEIFRDILPDKSKSAVTINIAKHVFELSEDKWLDELATNLETLDRADKSAELSETMH